MKSAVLNNPPTTSPTAQSRHPLAPLERPLTVDQLARAVGEHALRQAEIDQRIATRILELRDELAGAKDEIRTLQGQIEQLMHGLSQGLSLAHSQSARATQSSLKSAVAALKNR